MVQVNNNQSGDPGYAPKMDEGLKKAVNDWWLSLTKEEILDYLREQPEITADHLRKLLANNELTMSFGVKFDTNDGNVRADFHKA